MQQIKKIGLISCFLFLLIGVSTNTKADCILERLLDGGAGIGCGTALIISGGMVALVPGTLAHASSLKADSTFLAFCAGASYGLGAVLVAGGAKVFFDGVKKFFGVASKIERA